MLRITPSYMGGVNSFTFGLIDGFARVGNEHQFILFVTPGNRHVFEKYGEYRNFKLVEIREENHRNLRRGYARLPAPLRYRLPSEALNRLLSGPYSSAMTGEADVQYVPTCPPQLFPLADKPTIFSIHDVQHVHFPEFFTAAQRLERKVTFDRCVEKAALIQASSEYMRADFLRHLSNLRPEKVVIIHEGVDIEFFQRPRDIVRMRTQYGLPESFLFLPAQLWHHKNHLTLLRALKRLRDRSIEIPLVMTGRQYAASNEIFDFIGEVGLGSQVFYLGTIPFEDVAALYQAARYLVMPSLYESNSLPVLEAAAAGAGIIAGRIPPNEELSAYLDMQLFDPADDEGLAGLLAATWKNDTHEQVEKNKVAVSRFSWDHAARQYIGEFQSLGARVA